jgi:hypothetical protein
MKKFYPTYLCIKTHTITGLKYFCKTTKHNYHSYSGSGIYWKRHLKEHGWHFTTELLGFYTNKEECTAAAINFSIDNDIVKVAGADGKKIWANQIMENGLDGGDTSRTLYNPHSEESKKKMSDSRKGSIPWNKGKKGVNPGNTNSRTDEQKDKISKKLTGRKRNPESVNKTAEKLRGRKRPDVSERLLGKKKTPETIEKMKLAQQNKGPMKDETKQKIKDKRKLQVFTVETKEKLKGKIVCINKIGEIKKIEKEIFYSQSGSNEQKDWVFHNSNEGKKRKQN